MKQPIVIDFETEAIEDHVSPEPVGVAIAMPGKAPRYLAWGHPTENNCTKEKAREILKDLFAGDREILFHNAKFDLRVAAEHLEIELPSWQQIHDTMFLLFLTDPHAPSLSLKPSAERLLGMPPEERDAVRDWLVDHHVIAKNQNPGPYISKAPGKLVGEYAIGDVVRTKLLYEHLMPKLDKKMRAAYDRERALLPILMENEVTGVQFDVERATSDLEIYESSLELADAWLRKRLKVPGLNLDADADVGEALFRAKVVTDFVTTKTGKRSVAKKNLTIDRFNDLDVFKVLGYRNRLQTVLGLNLRPWLAQAKSSGGRIYTEWNQVRQSHGNDAFKGARTGRLSCSRFQNISKSFTDKGDGYEHPTIINVPELPLVRKYILPDKGHVFVHRDYNQQEFRITAHYEDGALREAYQKNPRIDYHNLMQQRLKDMMGIELARRPVKILNFGIEYGMGSALLAMQLGCSLDEAKRLIRAVKDAAPGIKALDDELKERGREGTPIRTWGGRLYYCEPPSYSKKHKREMTYEYKLLNYLIQGSAADCTKEAIIRYHAIRKDGHMIATVHDEINLSAPKKAAKAESELLRKAMESIEFDVPMLTDAKYGPSWGELS